MTNSNGTAIAKHIVLLFVTLFAIALITRMPAMYFANIYALHGVLSAALFAAVLAFCFTRHIAAWQYCVAVVVLAGILGLMSPVMGLSFLIVAVFVLLVSAALIGLDLSAKALTCGVVVGLACYLAPVIAGVIFGSFVFAGGAVLQVVLLALVSGLLGAAGAMVALLVFNK